MSRSPSPRRIDPCSPTTNPHAEKINAEELPKVVKSFYGTKTLMVDRDLAEAMLQFNTANRSVSARKVDRLRVRNEGRKFLEYR